MSPKKTKSTCLHLRQVECGYVAAIPGNGCEYAESVARCLDCGAFIPASADLVEVAIQVSSQKHCERGKPLSQPYAIEMGECVSCCLRRLRGETVKVFWTKSSKRNAAMVTEKKYGTTDPAKIEERRRKHREYYREYRARQRAEGLAG